MKLLVEGKEGHKKEQKLTTYSKNELQHKIQIQYHLSVTMMQKISTDEL